jgi:hypothetical protein
MTNPMKNGDFAGEAHAEQSTFGHEQSDDRSWPPAAALAGFPDTGHCREVKRTFAVLSRAVTRRLCEPRRNLCWSRVIEIGWESSIGRRPVPDARIGLVRPR